MFPRFLTPAVSEALSDSPVVFLNGARQTGKSTLVQGLAAGRHPARYVTFDDMTALSAAKGDPKGFLSGPVILDEVQRAPDLFLPLKAEVDRDRRPRRFLLTGSGRAHGDPHPVAAVARGDGRRQGGLHRRGVRRRRGVPVVRRRRPRGNLGARRPRRVSRAGRPAQAGTAGLLGLLAARSASLLNFAERSRAMALPQTTLKRYLALLEATFLARRLPAWSGDLGKRLVKAPKLFLNDTGLAASLLGLDAEGLAAGSPLTGPLVEAFVAAEWIDLPSDLLCVGTSAAWDPSRRVELRRKRAKFPFINLLAAAVWAPDSPRSPEDFERLDPARQSAWLEWAVAQELFRRAALRGDPDPERIPFWPGRDHELDFAWFPRTFPRGRLTVICATPFETDRIRGVTLESFLSG